MSVDRSQRFTRSRPCPICQGYDNAPRGRGIRCYGFASEDGAWAHCTREEHAGQLVVHPSILTFAHRLDGPCKCGVEHGMHIPVPVCGAGHSRSKTAGHEALGTPACAYVYRGPGGEPRHRTLRYRDPKSFRQQRYEGGRWLWGIKTIEPVLYRLPELRAADLNEPVFVTEGERDADRLATSGLIATTNPNGSKGWDHRFDRWLRRRHLIILEDNDTDGRRRTQELCHALRPIAARIDVIRFPDMPEGADVSDWLDAGGSVETLLDLAGPTQEEATA